MLGSRFYRELELLTTKRIRSLLLIPVLYSNLLNEKQLIGCFRVTSASKPIPITLIPKAFNFADLFVKTLKQINIQKIKSAQKVTNISRTGFQIHIKNENLARQFAVNPEEIVLDLTPNPLFRFRFFGKAMNMFTESDGGFNVGMRILGCDNKTAELSDWYDYIHKSHSPTMFEDQIIN